jgi:hypothetical protein
MAPTTRSKASQVPTPPTTGRLPIKRARPSVDADDETPIKKPRARGKGKGKSRVEEIADNDGVEPEEVVIANSEEEREEVVIADSEEEREVVIPDSDEEWEVRATAEEVEEQVEKDKGKGRATAEDVARGEEEEPGVKPPRRVEEEEVGDDLAFDPEGEALDEDEEDREVEEDEEVEEGADLLARLHSLARPVEKIAGSRRRESIKLSCSVDSFKAVNIGRAGPLPPKSNEVQLQCILEFVNRMKFVIHQRYQLAHSLSRIDENSPFTYAMWIWWTCQTEEEIWTLVHDAVDRSRQIVLGGIFLG